MYQRSVLDNQLRVLTSTMPHTRSVSVVINVGAGSRYESLGMSGISHFLEHLPFKGTKRWPTSRDVSEAIEGVGGVMNASTDREMTAFWCKVAQPHFHSALAVLLDMILNPLLDPEELEKEREVIQEELRMTNDYPTYKVDLLIDEALWPEQALGRDVGGTSESVNAISRDAILKYMHHQYNPANTVMAVAGNITHQEVLDLVGEATKDWEPQESLDWEPVNYGYEGAPVRMEQRRTDQTHLCLALPGLSLEDPDRFNLAMLNVMLGDGMSSRLFLNLREQQSLAYDVSSSINHFRDCGSLVVYCGVEPRKSREAVRATIGELEQLRQEAPEQELAKAKEYAKGRLLLRLEDTRSVASWLASQELLQGRVSTPDEAVQCIDAVTVSDVARVAQNLFCQEKLRLAVVGPHRSDKSFTKLLQFQPS
jgi:predicted Zn-dependent peptidase